MPLLKIGAILLLLLSLGSCTEVKSNKPKVIVLGFDGAGWDTIDPLIEAGKLPRLALMKQTFAWSPLRTFKPTKSPVIWTSVATGKSMAKHGVLDFVYLEKNNIQVPYSNSERREPSIWQILDHFGQRSIVINWFVTYPPDVINGIIVSNRFRKTLLVSDERKSKMSSSVHPTHLFENLLTFANISYEAAREQSALPDLPADHKTLGASTNNAAIPVLRDYPIYVMQEAMIENTSQYLFETEDFDLFATYFRLPDIVQHMGLELADPTLVKTTLTRLKSGELKEDEAVELREAISSILEPFYRYMENIIKQYTADDNTYVIVLSDHGFALHASGYDHYHIPETRQAPDGIFMMKGPDVKPGPISSVSVYDIAPTVLHLLGLPPGEDMEGTALTSILTTETTTKKPVRYTRDLMKQTKHDRDPDIDNRTLDELRSLGYIK